MIKRAIHPFDYAETISRATWDGVLFTTKADDAVNTMVIGWGMLGNVWKKPMYIAYVRTSRYSYGMIEKSGEFTINVAPDGIDRQVFRVAGTKSGRDMDKVSELGLTLVEPEVISTPGILECPLTLECKVVYKQHLDKDAILADIVERCYPPHITDIDAVGNCYYHVAYYGEIVSSYMIEDN